LSILLFLVCEVLQLTGSGLTLTTCQSSKEKASSLSLCRFPSQPYRRNLLSVNYCIGGPGSSLGIATDYGLNGPGIESRWGRDFPPVQTSPGAHPVSCTMDAGSFPGVKCGRGVLLTTHPLLLPLSWKSRAIPLPTLWATPGL